MAINKKTIPEIIWVAILLILPKAENKIKLIENSES